MNEDCQEETPTASVNTRYRNPTFTKEEVKVLLKLVEKHKIVILNRSTSASANHAKEIAWNKITKTFNKHHLKHERNIDSLKIKWDNLKKDARKLSKNLLDVNCYDFDDVTRQIVALISESESNSGVGEKQPDCDMDSNELEAGKETNDLFKKLDSDGERDSGDNDDDSEQNAKFVNRSMNFSPEECSLLVQCVKQEKKHVLAKATTTFANKLKNRAWNRITNSYNKLSPQKRSTKVLRTKFTNMKRMAKTIDMKDFHNDVSKKHERLDNTIDTVKKIKAEPVFEYKLNCGREKYDLDDDHSDIYDKSNDNHMNFVPDPLSTVLNSDSGIELINPFDNKEVVKLKIDLLKYKMETAKLERKRVEDRIRSQELESSLRIRAARLEAVAAAMRLPPSHPALAYTVDEAPAQQYLHQYHDEQT